MSVGNVYKICIFFSLKLISTGKVLKDYESLEKEGVKNGQQILAILLSESPSQVIEKENQLKDLENAKTDSKLLSMDDEYMQVKTIIPINIIHVSHLIL